jgi:hypothetical protein
MLPITVLTVLVAMVVISEYAESARFIFLLRKLVDMVKSEDFLSLASLAVLSGGRFLTVLMGYNSLSDGFGLGHGIAAYQEEYSRLSVLANLDWAQYSISEAYTSGDVHKPNAYGAQIALDMGVVGLVTVILIVFFCWRQKGKQGLGRSGGRLGQSLMTAVFFTAALIIFFRSTTAMPVSWVMLAFVHDFIKNGIHRKKALRGTSQLKG